MNPGTKVLVLLGIGAAAHFAVGAAQLRPTTNAAITPLTGIPASVMGFRQVGPDIPVDPHVFEMLDFPDILMRDYTSQNGIPVQLTVVRSGTTRRSLHFPEVCLTGQGWEVEKQYRAPVSGSFVANRLEIFKGESEQAVLYWFMTGVRPTESYAKNSLYWAKERLLFRSPRTMMVKLSTPVGSAGAESAFGYLEDFAQNLTPILQERFE